MGLSSKARPGRPSHRNAATRTARSVGPLVSRRFRERLLTWYKEYGRDLPWRKTKDPYAILVSEIMLQQTPVARVVPKYHEFLTRYPTLEELAEAPVSEVLQTWRPLGYNIRPLHLHSIAREVVEQYGGRIPSTPEKLLAFKGIGRSTAGALLSFAFNKDAPILDTNVMRVLQRVFLGPGDPKDHTKILWEISRDLIPKGRAYNFNQALMDFGALVCTARAPTCLLCPMRSFCKAYPM